MSLIPRTRKFIVSDRWHVLPVFTAILISACNSGQDESSDPGLSIGAAEEAKFVAIRVEAENFTEGHESWYVTDADNVPVVEPDPDPPHFSTAGGDSYMELLPDTRVTHDDPLFGGVNYWGDSNGGPSLTYRIDIPEPGRYLVYTKAYSTGTEDNGIHVGLNDSKPESGKRIQYCSGKNRWTWSSAQRTDENHCGVNKSIFLDVPEAGIHEIVYYAREDGFEIDQFILLKEPEDGSEVCEPYGFGHKIQCKDAITGEATGLFDLPVTQTYDGNIVTPPTGTSANVDLEIDIDADKESAQVGDEINYSVKVTNQDNADAATSVKVEITVPDGITFVSSSSCDFASGKVECSFNEITADSDAYAAFTATVNSEGTLRVDAKVTADQSDTSMGNNADSAEIDAAPATPPFAASLSVIHGTNTAGVDNGSQHLLFVKNVGLQPITNAQLAFNSASLQVTTAIESCSSQDCTLDNIDPGQTIKIPVTVATNMPGLDSLTVSLTASGDDNTADNEVTIPIRTPTPLVFTQVNGDVAIESENFEEHSNEGEIVEGAYNSAWFVTDTALQPTITPDFDNTPADTASGSAYVELLPDTRTGPDDPPIVGVSNFQSGDQSPALKYEVFFSQAGQYVIHARIRSNNLEDAGIHIGLNGQWPSSATGIGVCNPDGNWVWTNTLCDSGSSASISIATPGVHTIALAAATDGVEVDKLVLRNNNTESPEGMGPDAAGYSPVAIDLSIDSAVESGLYRLQVANPDQTEDAAGILVRLEGLPEQAATQFNGFDTCSVTGEVLNCVFESVDSNSTRTAELSLTETTKAVTARLVQANDPSAQNNVTTASTSGAGSLGLASIMLLLLTAASRAVRQPKP